VERRYSESNGGIEMSGSVWYSQVNKALKDLIPTIVKRYNKEQELVAVPAIVRTPESEFKVEKFPIVTIFPYGEKFSLSRFDDKEVLVSVDQQAGIGTLEEPARPYDLSYQIDFWSHYQEEIEEMTRRWCAKFTKFNVLEVKDTLNNTRSCFMKLTNIARSDTVKSKDERIFHRIYSYEIWVELDEGSSREVNLAVTREIQNGGGI
jgi:hypothetical protein